MQHSSELTDSWKDSGEKRNLTSILHSHADGKKWFDCFKNNVFIEFNINNVVRRFGEIGV